MCVYLISFRFRVKLITGCLWVVRYDFLYVSWLYLIAFKVTFKEHNNISFLCDALYAPARPFANFTDKFFCLLCQLLRSYGQFVNNADS